MNNFPESRRASAGSSTRRVFCAVILLVLFGTLPAIAQSPPPFYSDERLNDFLTYLDDELQQTFTPASSPLRNTGLDLWRSLSIIILVWTGLKIAYSGDFHSWEIVKLVILLWIPWVMLTFYDQPIPGMDLPFPKIIPAGANWIAGLFMADALSEMSTGLLSLAYTKVQELIAMWSEYSLYQLVTSGTVAITSALYSTFVLLGCLVLLGIIFAVGLAQLMFAKIALSILIFLGPLLIPWLVFPPVSFLFWGWFKGLLQYSLYATIAAAVLTIWCRISVRYIAQMANTELDFSLVARLNLWLITLLVLTVAAIFTSLKVGDIASTIVNGGGGDGGGLFAAGALAVRGVPVVGNVTGVAKAVTPR